MHAIVWAENGKVGLCTCDARYISYPGYDADGGPSQMYIQDMGSARGTWINEKRLSAEAETSHPCELKTNDVLVCALPRVIEIRFAPF